MKVNLSSAIIVPVTLILCGAGVYAYIKFESSNKTTSKVVTGSMADAADLSEYTNASANTQPQTTGTLGVNKDGTISLNQQSSSAQSTVPGPDQFTQYDKYRDDQNSLYAVLKQGDGDTAKSGDFVALVYKGWLTDGTLFDQSKKNEQGQLQALGITLGQGQVIRGWEESIPGMKVGEQRRLIIPPAVGYGAQGQGPIPPNAVLIFDVELVQVGQNPQSQQDQTQLLP